MSRLSKEREAEILAKKGWPCSARAAVVELHDELAVVRAERDGLAAILRDNRSLEALALLAERDKFIIAARKQLRRGQAWLADEYLAIAIGADDAAESSEQLAAESAAWLAEQADAAKELKAAVAVTTGEKP